MKTYISYALIFACGLLLTGCATAPVNDKKPAVVLGSAELGLPVYPKAEQNTGFKSDSKVEAVFDTKDDFYEVYKFYTSSLGSKIRFELTDRGGTARFASGSYTDGSQSFQINLKFNPIGGRTEIRLSRSWVQKQTNARQ